MVMETPSPQAVGREFVRQYYTLMNEAPNFLHRFYSTNSSFIHSGVDKPGQEAEPVYGQKEIHKKITEMNFADCHTKIRQVDSQATVGEGVVVQVTGELSNRAGPMRRFMQTFVLAHTNPKQYYVHNDIFRYQDEVFRDSYESEDETEHHVIDAGMENGIMNAKPENQETEEMEAPESPPPSAPSAPSPVKSETPEPVEADCVPQEEPAALPEPEPVKPPVASPTKTEKPEVEIPTAQPGDEVSNQPAKPFSWANVAMGKSSGAASSAAVAVVTPLNSAPTASKNTTLPLSVISSQQKEEQENMTTSVTSSSGGRDEPAAASQQQSNRSNRSSMEPAGPGMGRRPPRGDSDASGRNNNEKYPDSQQVFVGNLPHDITDLGLKRFFNQYGKVIDIRINRGGTKVPFGFVVFDSEEPVTKLLKLQRVEMDGHRLNVEVKKARGEHRDRAPRPRNSRNPRPKDRENSGSRSDNRSNTGNRGFTNKW